MRVHVYSLAGVPVLYTDRDQYEAPPDAIRCGSLNLSRTELLRVIGFLEERTEALVRREDDVRWIAG